MKRNEIYDHITTAFEDKFSFLGRQFAEEFQMSCASYNIQTYSKPDFRMRRHLLLFWRAGWLKSSLLNKANTLLGPQLCTIMSDVSNAALRGTVEGGSFVSPFTLKRPFSICTEFGQVVSGFDSDIVQKLLNVLEEGLVTVSLGKIAYLSIDQREEATEKYGITFIDKNTFTYSTNWILIAGTYNKKFLFDNALESRFVIMHPEKKLDSNLTRHLTTSKKFHIDEDVAEHFKAEIVKDSPMDIAGIKLPNEVYECETPVSPRECAGLISFIACRSWWNKPTTKDDIMEKLNQMKTRSETVWKTADDKVFDAIEFESKTVPDIASELDVSTRQVYYSLSSLKRKGIVNKFIEYDEEENATGKWKVV